MPNPIEPQADKSLAPGLYDLLLDALLSRRLEPMRKAQMEIEEGEIDPGELHTVLSQYLERSILQAFKQVRGTGSEENLRRMAQSILDSLSGRDSPQNDPPPQLQLPLKRLLAIHPPRQLESTNVRQRPHSPLARSTLVTGGRSDLKLGVELGKEIRSAERVDILCSFILWSGLRVILDQLRELTAQSPLADGTPRLRVITTSYMGNTEAKALEQLLNLPNTEVRVNYDTDHARLHAKAYLIHRSTGFGSAYIGSANLSRSALSEGLEWTTKISQFEIPYLWEKVTQTFNGYWLDREFASLNPENLPNLRSILSRERPTGTNETPLAAFFDLEPHPFQQEILEDLQEERLREKKRQLIVAATGTGKTMIAAFDYRNVCREKKSRPSLLFIAHRREILQQALYAFRNVLRDQNFGQLVAGGEQLIQGEHLFCVINSYNSRGLKNLSADHFSYIVVDEFHHAAAASYRELLDHVKPSILLGLTATPERHDNLDILGWFEGKPSAEIRLPDAISRDFLVSFQYFGVSDLGEVDYRRLHWQRGGYRLDELEELLSTNSARAGLVIDKINEILLDPGQARALGFCVSIRHAEFMARAFNQHGLQADALSSKSSNEDREALREKLKSKEINFLFVVDLYNEGVDIPEIDTVLFLRPTESLTVFLQQLGRGLRRHPEKQCLTVIDLVGAHRKEYRFASRFKALLADRQADLKEAIEDDFSSLPPGCIIRLEKVARERILENIRYSLGNSKASIINGLKEYHQILGRLPGMAEAADFFEINLATLCKRGLWARLLADAGLIDSLQIPADFEKRIAEGLQRGTHWDDARWIDDILHYLEGDLDSVVQNPLRRIRVSQFLATVFGQAGENMTLPEADTQLRQYPEAVFSARELLKALKGQSHSGSQPLAQMNCPLTLHCRYSMQEILIGMGHWQFDSRPEFREGVLFLPEQKIDLFFVTRRKTEKDYSPTTLYEDFAISSSEFHWQTQSRTTVQSPTGQRYIHHKEQGYTPLLFVRETKKEDNRAAPYYFLGPCEYLRHKGDRPISIYWRLLNPMPPRIFPRVALESLG